MKKFFAIIFFFFFGIFSHVLFSPSPVLASNLTISGDPLQIIADDFGSMSVKRNESGSYGKQYFEDLVSLLFLDNSSLAFDSHRPGTLGAGDANTRFTASSHSQPNDWRIETVFVAGSTGVQIKRTLTYTNGREYYAASYEITNHSADTYSNIKFRLGGDTYFAGDDSSVGNWDSILKMVYLTNPSPSITHRMGMYGAVTSQADYYYNDTYSNVWTKLADITTSLPNTVNATDHDAGYGLEWGRASLAPGETWLVRVFEKWQEAGHVAIVAPYTQGKEPGQVAQYRVPIENYQTTEDTFTIQATSSNGWHVGLPNGNKATVGALSSAEVAIEVNVDANAPHSTTDILTITATSDTTSTITDSATVNTTVGTVAQTPSVPGPPACSDQAPTAIPSIFQIDTTQNSATLYFTPVNNNLTGYFIAYGLAQGDEQYSLEYPALPSNGVEVRGIENLSPNTEYFFHVRGNNGCATGEWSGWATAKTGFNPAFAHYEAPEEDTTNQEQEPETLGMQVGEEITDEPENENREGLVLAGGISFEEYKNTLIEEETEEFEEKEKEEEEKENKEGYKVQVKVEDQNQDPVQGVKVLLHSDPQEGLTDKNGEVLFENVKPGEHTIKIAYQNQTGEKKVTVEEGDVKEYHYTLQLEQKNPFLSLPVISVITILLILLLKGYYKTLKSRILLLKKRKSG